MTGNGAVLLDPVKLGKEAERLRTGLKQRIIGQDAAIDVFTPFYQEYSIGIQRAGKPLGVFLFLGPTGSGKTLFVEALAEVLFNNPLAVLKIDCAEFQREHETAKLTGAPPGYLGHNSTPALLSQKNLDKFHTEKCKINVVLFDEIEKASEALWKLLLGILDKGRLTLGDNENVDFSKTVIFMTSNLGVVEINRCFMPKIGFNFQKQDGMDLTIRPELQQRAEQIALAAAKQKFGPEFLNRLDRKVFFKPLSRENLDLIFNLELEKIKNRFRNNSVIDEFNFSLTPKTRQYLLNEGTNPEYGARELKRVLEDKLVGPLSGILASGQIENGDHVDVDFSDSKLVFLRREKNIIPQEITILPPSPRKVITLEKSNSAPVITRAAKA